MTTMKMKNGNQYKIQKSQNGGGNNADKNFMSRVEQGYISNTTSYLELFMNTIKIKDFCNRYQYEMQKSWDGGGNNAYKIFTSWVEEGYIPNTISYVELLMNTFKKNSAMDTSMKCKKARMEEGMMPIKSLCAGWKREILYANTKLVWSCS